MKGFTKGLLMALIVVMFVSSTFASAEGSLLAERMGQAYESGRKVEVSIGAKMGSGLAMFLPEETYGAIEQLLTDTRIVADWAKDAEGNPTMGLFIGIKEVEVLTGTARLTADGVAVTTNLLPGKTVLIPLESLTNIAEQQSLPVEINDESAALLMRAYETYFGILTGWAQANGGALELINETIPGTDARSEAASGMKLRLTAVQLKDLLVQLTEAFEKDTELQAALESYSEASGGAESSMADTAKALADMAKEFAPTDGVLTLDAYSDVEGNLVGLDFRMDPMFEGSQETVFAQYDRLDEDGHNAYGFQGRIGFGDNGQMAAKIEYSEDASHTENLVSQDLLLLGMMQSTGADPISQITLTDKRQTALNDTQEQMTDALELVAESLAPDGSAAQEGSMPMSVVISTTSVTNALGGDDFDSETTLSVQAMGLEFAVLNLTFTSGEFVPADTSGNTVVDLSTATPEEQEALMEELQMYLGMAVMGAMQAVPPELLAMMG